MAAGTSGTNTMAEGLRKVMGQLVDLKLTPDVDIAFIVNLETQIVAYLRQQAAGPGGGAGAPPPSPLSGASAPPGLMSAPGGPPGAMPGAGMPPGMGGPGPGMPNADEFQRMVGSQ